MLAFLIEATHDHFSSDFIKSIILRQACICWTIDRVSMYVLNGIYLAPMWPLLATVLSELLNCIIPNVDLITPCAHPMSQCNDQDKLFLCV